MWGNKVPRCWSDHICGLYYYIDHQRVYLPQVQLKSLTTINPVCFTTILTQTFRNTQASGVLSQVRYIFPLYDGVAVSGYTITYGSHTLRGIVQQKDDAKATYKAAIDRGETAGLLESLPAGVFGVTLGNIPPKTDVVVEITYCGELKHDAAIDGLRYNLPTQIAPRYGAYPNAILDSNAQPVGGIGISITVDVDMTGSAIRRVQSPSHPISVSMGALSTTDAKTTTFAPSQASATLTLGSAELAEDFILQLLIDDINRPQALIETHPTIPGQRAIMATLVPNFNLEPILPEVVFIADQSGSMSGSKNTALKAALLVFLKSLPLGVRFNICAFGTKHKFLWPKSQAYTEENLHTAVSFVHSLGAAYGGTEIEGPIVAAFGNRWTDLPLEVMLLTDGEVWNEGNVFRYIDEQIHEKGVDARVFALGIGSDVSHTLVEGVARAGNGFAQFVTQNEQTDQKVVRMLKCALFAHTTDYEVEVKYNEKHANDMIDDDEFEIVEKVSDCLKIDDKQEAHESSNNQAKTISFFDESAPIDEPIIKADKTTRYAHLPTLDTPKVVKAPHTIPPLFPVNRSTLYLLLGPNSIQDELTSLIVRAKSAKGPLELTIPVHASTLSGTTIHQLAARKAIQDLEEGRGWLNSAKSAEGQLLKIKYQSRMDEMVERECVSLGTTFQVAGKYASFVAVKDSQQVTGTSAEKAVEHDGEDFAGMLPQPPAPQVLGQRRYVNNLFAGSLRGAHGGSLFGQSHSPVTAPTILDSCNKAASPNELSFGTTAISALSMPSNTTTTDGGLFGISQDKSGFGAASSSFSGRHNTSTSGGALFGSSDSASCFGAEPIPYTTPSNLFGPGGLFGSSLNTDSAKFLQDSEQDSDDSNAPVGASRFLRETNSEVADDSDTQPASLTINEKVHALIGLQNFSGSWNWCDELFTLLEVEKSRIGSALVTESKASQSGGDDSIAATALAISFLEHKAADLKDVWDMVVAKARQWLSVQAGLEVDNIVQRAAGFL